MDAIVKISKANAFHALSRSRMGGNNQRQIIWILQGIAHLILIFSSRENIRISLISVSKKRFNTALPKEPVPPVINRILSLNMIKPQH